MILLVAQILYVVHRILDYLIKYLVFRHYVHVWLLIEDLNIKLPEVFGRVLSQLLHDDIYRLGDFLLLHDLAFVVKDFVTLLRYHFGEVSQDGLSVPAELLSKTIEVLV